MGAIILGLLSPTTLKALLSPTVSIDALALLSPIHLSIHAFTPTTLKYRCPSLT